MADYRKVPVKFQNGGVVQRLDSDFLTEGQFYDMLNVTSLKEGTLTSRFGSTRLSPAIGSLIHTLEVFELEAAQNKQFMYIGEGTDIYRARMDQLTSAPTNMGASLPAWGQRWSAAKMDAGLAAKPYLFIAASKMLKDPALTNTGVATTAFQNWGILPPPAAPATALASEVALSIASTPSTTTWTSNPDESYKFKGTSGLGSAIALLGSAVDLSQFNGTTPSGSAGNGYDSGDLIELTIQPKNPARFEYFILQFEVSTTSGEWNDYYEKVIVPNQLTASSDTNPLTTAAQRSGLVSAGILGYGSSLVPVTDPDGSVRYVVAEADNEFDRSRPVELPSARTDDGATGPVIKVSIPKNAFSRTGAAGQAGKNWANVKAIRLWAKSAVVGDADLTLTFTSLRMVGGSGLYNAKPGLAPYEWAYTYRNDATGHESNPSPLMVDDRYMRDVERRAVALSSIVQSSDSQVGSIGIYRRGGTLGQDFRLVGYITNGTTTFTDTLADSDLIYSKLLEFDNDPPVTSKMPTAFMATFAGDGNTGNRTIAVTMIQPAGQTAAAVLTVGTRLLVQDSERTEWVQVQALSGNDITVNFQAPHNGTIRLYTSSVVGVPCRFTTRAGMSVFLAGDQNNPHILYKSKSGRPESFPVVADGTETVHQIQVGSPSNPILGLGEYGGEVVCLNRYSIFVVRIFNGQMQDPIQTPSQRGVVCEGGWCRGENELYFLSDDGVYRWAGGAAEKISDKVDWFFRGKEVNGRLPMARSVSALEYVKMAFFQGELHLVCRDTAGNTVKWVYNPVGGGRWCPNTPALEGATYSAWSTLHAFQDKLYAGRFFTSGGTSAYLYEEETGYRDNGNSIPFMAQTGFYVMGNPSMNKQWGDVVVEFESTNTLTVKVYYDFNATTPDQTLTIPGAAGRRRIPLPFNTGSAKEAYALGFRFEGESSSTAPVTLHSITFTVLDLAEIQRGRASDWMDGGYPFDKRLDQLIVEYDTAGTTVTLNLDTISGIAGNVQTLNVASFTLTGSGRAKPTFPIKKTSDGSSVICKMYRLRPTATSTDFKIFGIDATFEKYPPDTTLFTEPSDLGYMCEKVFRTVTLDMDTGSTVCGVGVWVDGVNVANFSHTGSATDRVRTYSFVSNITNTLVIGRLVQLRFTPHASGRNQLFDVKYEFTREPCAKTFFDTFEQYFGSNGYKYMKQVWIEYRSQGAITMKIYRDGGTLFYTKVLPQQSYRDVQRFYLPAINSGVLNKSHSYRITIESNTAGQHFYLYRDSTRIETMNLTGDARSAYAQHYLWDEMPIQK